MEENKRTENYKTVAEAISKNFSDHEKNIKQFRVTSCVASLDDFHSNVDKHAMAYKLAHTPTKNPVEDCPISDYEKLLSTLEEYPINLQKPAKKSVKPSARPQNAGTDDSQDKTIVSKRSLSPPRSLMEPPTALQTYQNFKEFKQKLSRLSTEMKDVSLTKQYLQKLDQLYNFAKQLEKILPNDVHSLNEEEIIAIKVIQDNLEDFINIQKLREMQQGNDMPADPVDMTFMRSLALALNEIQRI